MEIKLSLSRIRTDLEKQRKDLIEQMKADVQLHQQTVNPDRSDLAWQYIQGQRDVLLSEKTEKRLAEIDSALERIKDGRYGKCERCGQGIHPVRFETIPTVTMCIQCKSQKKMAKRKH